MWPGPDWGLCPWCPQRPGGGPQMQRRGAGSPRGETRSCPRHRLGVCVGQFDDPRVQGSQANSSATACPDPCQSPRKDKWSEGGDVVDPASELPCRGGPWAALLASGPRSVCGREYRHRCGPITAALWPSGTPADMRSAAPNTFRAVGRMKKGQMGVM